MDRGSIISVLAPFVNETVALFEKVEGCRHTAGIAASLLLLYCSPEAPTFSNSSCRSRALSKVPVTR